MVPEWTRSGGIVVVILALAAYVHLPLLDSGFLGEDLVVLASLDEATSGSGLAPWYGVEGTAARPLGALSLFLSRALWTEGGYWSGEEARWLRLEHLGLLLLAAWGSVGLVRRALRPWVGLDPAKSAGYAGAALVLLHPLTVTSVARVASRGDLALLALGVWAAGLFLGGRQEGRRRRTMAAFALTVVAGFLSPLVLLMPVALAALEYSSTRRHRRRRVRLRTSATTLVVFGVAALVESLGRWRLALPGDVALIAAPPAAPVGLWLEKLGVLVLPANTYGLGRGAQVLAGLALALAVHPAFVAVRAAPRLWGRVAVAWSLALALAIAPTADVRVIPGSLERAQVLLPAAVVMGLGLGLAATALSGWRRTLVPTLVGVVFALLGRAVAVPRALAAEVTTGTHEELLAAGYAQDWRGTLLLLDPPRSVAGVDPLGPDLAALISPAVVPALSEGEQGPDLVGLSSAALAAWMAQDEFTELRRVGALVLVDGARFGSDGGDRRALSILRPGQGVTSTHWLEKGQSRAGVVLDPVGARFITVTALPDASTEEAPILRWTAEGGGEALGPNQARGVWLEGDGEPVAVFDLERALTWVLGDRVLSAWFLGALNLINSARVGPEPRHLAGAVPHVDGLDWTVDLAGLELRRPLAGQATWRLGMLDLVTLEHVEFTPDESEPGRLRFVGAVTWMQAHSRTGAAVAWYLDRRLDGLTIARNSGRRAGRIRNEPEEADGSR